MNDSQRLDKAQIAERLRAEHRRLYDTLAKLTPEERAQPHTLSDWSVKDVMAHMVFWNRYPLRELECALKGEHPDTVRDARHDDVINAEAVARCAEMGFEQVIADFEQSYRELLAAVELLPAQAFEAGSSVEQLLGSTVGQTLDSNTYEHWAEHRVEIETRFNLQH
ncbi:MAG: maleylpyruvate isomerase N-terminal domain-containing protein [Chloroflexi bacterium]|nr:maleylpyruvate isomerase N-terminal domain-containing protein [Chloroflexota bacterium]